MELPPGVEIADGVTLHPAPIPVIDSTSLYIRRFQLSPLAHEPITPEIEACLRESLDRIISDHMRRF